MRGACALAVCALALMLPACGALGGGGDGPAAAEQARGLGRVQAGMSAQEVRALVGEPVKVEEHSAGRGEIWYYYDGGVVILYDGQVANTYPAAAPDS